MFMLIVGGWYKKREQALRMGAWYSATGYVSMVSPLINYGLGHISGGGLNSWQYMYLVAGAITVLWSFVILFFMPPDPIRARGFSDRERYIAVARMKENNSGVRNTHFKVAQVWESLYDIKFWLIFSIAFLMMIANGPVSSFIPIIISGQPRRVDQVKLIADNYFRLRFWPSRIFTPYHACRSRHWHYRTHCAILRVQDSWHSHVAHSDLPMWHRSCLSPALATASR